MAPKSGDLTFTFEVPQDISLTLQLPLGDVTNDLDYTITWNETETPNGPLSYTVPTASTTQTVTAKLQLHAGAITAFDTSKWLGIEFLTNVTVGNASTPFVYYKYNDNFEYVPEVVTTTYVDPFWGLNAKFRNIDDDGGMVHDPSFGVKTLDSLFENAVKLQKVPEVFLVSGVTMDNMFKNATVFNDPVVKNWNIFYIIPYIDSRFDEPQEAIWRVENYIQSAISTFEGAVAFDQPIVQLLRNEEKSFVPNMTNISKNSKLSSEDSFRQGFLGVDTLDSTFLKIYIDTDPDIRTGLNPYKTVYTDVNDDTYDYIFTLTRNSRYYVDQGTYLSTPFTIDELVTYTTKNEIKKMDLTLPDGTMSPFDNQTEQQAKDNISRILQYTNLFDSGEEFWTWRTFSKNEKIPIRIIYHETGYFNNAETSEKKVSFIELERIEVRTKDEYRDDGLDLSKPETLELVTSTSTATDYKISTDKYGNLFVDSVNDYEIRFNIINEDAGWSSQNTSYNYFVTFKSSADEDYSDLAHWLLLDLVHKEHKGVPMLPFQISDAKNYNLDNGQNESWEVFGTSKDEYLGKLLIADDTTSMPDYNSNIGKDILRSGIIIDNGEYSDIISSRRELLDSKKSTLRALQTAYTTHIRKRTVSGKPASVGIGNVYDDSEEDADITWNFFRAFFSGRDQFNQYLGNSSVKTRILYWQEGLDSVDPTTDAYISYLEIGLDGLWRQFKKVPVDDKLEPAIYIYADIINRFAIIKDRTDLIQKINAWYTERDLNGIDAANALIAGDPKHFITTKVTDFTGIFYNKIGENHPDIRYWDVGSATSLYYMFQNSTFNNYIGTWERKLPGEVNTNSPTLKNVTNMSWLFKGNEEFNQSIGNWNTSSVTTMYLMFAEASKFNQPIGNWNTSNVTTMKSMFRGASKFNQNINTKLVTQHGVEYTAWDTKLVTTMDSMFERAKKFNYAIQKWNTSNVITMKNMFKAASMFNKSLSTNYKTDNYEFPNNKTIKFKLRLEDTYNHPDDWQNNKWKNMTNDPTVSRYALIDKGVTIKDQDGNILTMREVEYFQNDTGNKDVEIDNIKIIFDDQKYDLEVENINTFREFTVDFTLGTNTKYYITSGDEMYDEMKISLTSLDEDYPIAISYNGVDAENKNNDLLLDDDIIKKRMNAKNDTWNTVNVRTMEQMFLQAESFNGNISNWDTSSVKTMHRMFSGFDSMNIDKIFYNEFAVTDGGWSRVKDNQYMVLSSTFYIGGRDNPGENSFALASSRFSTWESDKQQFPITFKEGGKITFSAKAPNDVIVYFGFNEDKTGKIPTTTYETNKVTITPTVNKYEITIPPHTTEYYNVFLHLGTYDIMATITDVIIEYDNKKEKDYTRPMSFDKNIGAWDVRNVTNFKQMFKNNKAFDNSESDLIDGWKTAND